MSKGPALSPKSDVDEPHSAAEPADWRQVIQNQSQRASVIINYAFHAEPEHFIQGEFYLKGVGTGQRQVV